MSVAAAQASKFYEQVVRDGLVFTFEDADGLLVFRTRDVEVVPFWSSRKRLEQIQKKMPKWGGDIALDFQDIYYYLKPADHQGKTWDDVPEEIKKTFSSSCMKAGSSFVKTHTLVHIQVSLPKVSTVDLLHLYRRSVQV